MTASLVNHLWQSTLVAGLAWLVTLALRRDRAGVRYAVWLAASLKFLVPFSLVMALGGRFGIRPVVRASFVLYQVMVDAGTGPVPQAAFRFSPGQPPVVSLAHRIGSLLPDLLLAAWILGAAALVIMWCVRWRRVAAIVRAAAPVTSGPVHDALRRLETAAGLRRPIALVESRASLEPGVFGILRPTLVWPSSIGAHLNTEQVEAILIHEIMHAVRRDNVAAAAHMAVEAAFWFHPMVWWLGARLVDERERACDEAVLVTGREPHAYAESILKTCQLLVESPIACVSGVTGSDLKKRIEHIMTDEIRPGLNGWKKSLLASAAAAAVAVPFVAGIVVPTVRAQQVGVLNAPPAGGPASAGSPAFDVTSVKPNNSGSGRISIMPGVNGGFQAENVTLGMMIRMSNQLQDNQIVGGPKWLFEDRFDMIGAGTAPGRDGTPMEKFRTLLVDRFKLVTHREQREQPMFSLVLARKDGKLGDKMTVSTVDCTPQGPNGRGRGPQPLALGERPKCGAMIGPGRLLAGGQTMAAFATQLSRFVGGIVVDKTGLTGTYDLELSYAPDGGISGFGRDLPPQQGAPPPAVNSDAPSIFSALQEQIGLKLEAGKGTIDVLVVDSAEHPAAD